MHGRLPGISHASPEYIEAIRAGLADVIWPGRCQRLQDNPLVYLDGAINRESADSLVESVRGFLVEPVISIIGVPEDKDYRGVYDAMGQISQQLILTETARNPILRFPSAEQAIATARVFNPNVIHLDTLSAAIEHALPQAGTLLIVGTQSIVADAISLWNLNYEKI